MNPSPDRAFQSFGPCSLANIATRLAGAKINIEYAYCATAPQAKNGLLILRASNCKKALKVLNG